MLYLIILKRGINMKLCAIICEYNPFHNGHQYLIQQSLEQTGCDAVLCIMGGNFSQRGEPCVVDKITRAQMAIEGGASAVVQIPTYFCTATAEIFAQSAIKIATSFKNVTHIAFGSECGDIRSITELARFFNQEPEFFKKKIKQNLADGYSLGASKTKALQECIEEKFVKFSHPDVVAKLLDSPNNILGIEYMRVLLNSNRKDIKPITVKRIETFEDSENLNADNKLTTASALRSALDTSNRLWSLKKYMPSSSFKLLSKSIQTKGLPNKEKWINLLLYKLRISNANELKLNFDVCEGIENKLISTARLNVNYEGLMEGCTSRRFTRTRIQRILLACLLSLRDEYTKEIYKLEKMPYIKLLACKKNEELLASLAECDTVLVARKQDAVESLNDPFGKILMYAEDRANNLYSLLLNLTKDQQKDYSTSDIYQKTLFL